MSGSCNARPCTSYPRALHVPGSTAAGATRATKLTRKIAINSRRSQGLRKHLKIYRDRSTNQNYRHPRRSVPSVKARWSLKHRRTFRVGAHGFTASTVTHGNQRLEWLKDQSQSILREPTLPRATVHDFGRRERPRHRARTCRQSRHN